MMGRLRSADDYQRPVIEHYTMLGQLSLASLPELSMGWVDPWVGLGWVVLGPL